MNKDECPICSKAFNQSDEIYGTKCDHLFHHGCLNFWLTRSETCPQCDRSVTRTDIQKIDIIIDSRNTGSNHPRSEEQADEKQNETLEVLNDRESERQNSVIVCQTTNSQVTVERNDRRAKRSDNDDSRYRRQVQGPTIYNEGGTVIVCDTYAPSTVNYFGFWSSKESTPAPAVKSPWYKRLYGYVFNENNTQAIKGVSEAHEREAEAPNRAIAGVSESSTRAIDREGEAAHLSSSAISPNSIKNGRIVPSINTNY